MGFKKIVESATKTLAPLTFTALTACGGLQKANPTIDTTSLTICAKTKAALCTQDGTKFPYNDGETCQDTVSVTMQTSGNKQELAFCRKPAPTMQIAVCQAINKILDGLDISSHFDLEDKCETKKPQKSSP